MTTQHDELAREIFIADNGAQPREESLRDWAAYTAGSGTDTYAHKIADGLIAHGYGKLPDPPRYKCEACGYADDEADSKFWRCSLCGCLDHESATS